LITRPPSSSAPCPSTTLCRSGLHARRHEAELKLQAAETNLARLDDVIATLAAQIETLRKQARQAQRYRRLPRLLAERLDLCGERDRKSTRLNSSHGSISYAVY